MAIFAGSFKPPHRGHLFLIEKLLENPEIDKIYIIISQKPRDGITAEQSFSIWTTYLSHLQHSSKNADKSKIRVLISSLPSPITMAYHLASRQLKYGDTLVLVRSSKNAENTRFQPFEKLGKQRGFKVEDWTIPQMPNLNATNMRNAIQKRNKHNFMKFLPAQLPTKEKEEIWLLLTKKK